MDSTEEIKEVLLTLANTQTEVEVALNKIIDMPNKYVEKRTKDYLKVYLDQINCNIRNTIRQINRDNYEVIEDMFEVLCGNINELERLCNILKENK